MAVTDGELHALLCEWATWVRSKRLYAPSPNPQSVIGSLVRLPGGREGNARLTRHSEALLALLEAIKRHGTDCDEFQDACRDALRVMAG